MGEALAREEHRDLAGRPDGSMCHDLAQMAAAATDHFGGIFAAPPPLNERQRRLSSELLESQLCNVLEGRWVDPRGGAASKVSMRCPEGCRPRRGRHLALERVDWTPSGNFNLRFMNDGHPLASDQGCREVMVRLMSKAPLPEVFKHFRPSALLNASAEVWSRLMFVRLQQYDENREPCSTGLKNEHGVAELVLCFRPCTLQAGGSSRQHSSTSRLPTTASTSHGC